MAFEVYIPLKNKIGQRPGQAQLNKSRTRLMFHADDLAFLEGSPRVTLLVDETLRRLAIRKPKIGEATLRLTPTKYRKAYFITAATVLRKMRKPEDDPTFQVMRKDDLLIAI